MRRRSTTLQWIPGLAVTLFFSQASGLSAQQGATVLVEENFRRAPNEVVLARLSPGTPLTVVGRRDNWLEVDVEGWVWLNSLQVSADEYDLVVTASGGENLRDAPSGEIIGRLEEGALLEEVSREPGWARVRRSGWIWSESVSAASAAPSPTRSAPTSPSASTDRPSPAGGASAPDRPAARLDGYARIGNTRAAILTAPDGDTLAVVSPDRDLEVLARQGSWARVRVEGWTWIPEAASATAVDSTPSELTPAELAAEPGAHVGRVVAWRLQFISLEEAEAIRTDFREGEPFLLSRFGGQDGPFVYVAVPPERRTEVAGLVPLERIEVTGRVRTGASSLTGTPIIDLLGFERVP